MDRILRTPTRQHSTLEQEQQTSPSLTSPPVPPPLFLQRLCADYARQLRRSQGDPLPSLPPPESTSATPSSSVPSSSYTGTDYSGSSSSSSNGGTSSLVSPGVYALAPPPFPSSFPLPRSLGDPAAWSGESKALSIGSTTPVSFTPSKRLEDVYAPPKEIVPEDDLLPPENFAMVTSFVYRSSFPKRKHFPFLKSLGLKSVL